MLYYLFHYLYQKYHLPGAGLFEYISFRAAAAIITSLVISMVFGKSLINYLRNKQIGERVRDLGLQGEEKKQGTPTMGGFIIIGAIVIPVLLFARLENVYIIILLIATLWLGFVGFMDDYIKVFKKDKRGLAGWFKVAGQVGLGICIGCILHFNSHVVVRRQIITPNKTQSSLGITPDSLAVKKAESQYVYAKLPITTIPFVKTHEFNYSKLISWLGSGSQPYTWLVYMAVITIIIIAVSNGANITDGIDGLATGTSAIIGATLGIFAWVSGNILAANYLNIMYIPNTGELMVYSSAFIGACIGFLWYNAYPAQVFMGDTGSLAIGGIIATLAIVLRKELLIPLLCGIFLIENLSVVMQVAYFKYTKRKYGEGRRIFKMSPLHHHYQKLGHSEPKIVTRFWIVGILLAVLTLVTLKIR